MDVYDLLVELTGDSGADTLARYFAQIEYTAHCCIRMLYKRQSILSVTPETGDDVLISFGSHYEMHQAKTRNETKGPWMASDIATVMAGQFVRAQHLDKPSTCVFVSNAPASDSKAAQNCYDFARYKYLQTLVNGSNQLSSMQRADHEKSNRAWQSALIDAIVSIDNSFDVSNPKNITQRSRVDTDNPNLRAPTNYTNHSGENIYELGNALVEENIYPQGYNFKALGRMYEELLLLILRRTIFAKRGSQRAITRADTITCCLNAGLGEAVPVCLAKTVGQTLAERKANLGGFDQTEFGMIEKQRLLGEIVLRELKISHTPRQVELLSADLIALQMNHRRKISESYPLDKRIGPRILDAVTDELKRIPNGLSLAVSELLGVMWLETNECRTWWHGRGTENIP